MECLVKVGDMIYTSHQAGERNPGAGGTRVGVGAKRLW